MSYAVTYSFANFQAYNPAKSLPGPQLDKELANIATAFSGLTSGLANIRRSDGQLVNGIVTLDSLEPTLRAGVASAVSYIFSFESQIDSAAASAAAAAVVGATASANASAQATAADRVAVAADKATTSAAAGAAAASALAAGASAANASAIAIGDTTALFRGQAAYDDADDNIAIADEALNVVLGTDSSGRTISASVKPVFRRSTSELVWYLWLEAGQSLAVGFGATEFLSSAPNALTLGGGPRSIPQPNYGAGTNTSWSGVKALAEDNVDGWGQAGDGNTACSAAADTFQRLCATKLGIPVSSNIVAASIIAKNGQLLSALQPGGAVWYVFADVLEAWITAAAAAGARLILMGVDIDHGQANAQVNTDYTTYRDGFLAWGDAFDQYARNRLGQKRPVTISVVQCSHLCTTTNGQIAQAQYDACLADERFHFIGPTWKWERLPDKLHMPAMGQVRKGLYRARQRLQLIDPTRTRTKNDWLQPKLKAVYSVSANTITWGFDYIPKPPVIFDSTLATFQRGFRETDPAGDATLTSPSIIADEMVFTPSRPPDFSGGDANPPMIRAGKDYTAPTIAAQGAGTVDVRDSTADVLSFQGLTMTLYYEMPSTQAVIVQGP